MFSSKYPRQGNPAMVWFYSGSELFNSYRENSNMVDTKDQKVYSDMQKTSQER